MLSALPRPRGGDVVAGLSVALILIPQSLAYAEIAGVPAYVGLYAAALPPLAAAFFASSPYLQTGPVAMTALLTFGALTATGATPGSREYVALAALLALIVGLVRIGMGLLRSGFFAYLMSQPVLVGFTSAAAILITSSQLPVAAGTQPPDGKLLAEAWWAITHVTEWQPASVGLAVVTVAVIVGGQRLHRLFPGVLAAVVIGIAYSLISEYTGPTVGDVPAGLPPFSLDLPWRSLPSLLVPGAVIALVGFAEAAAISRTFATQDRQTWSPDRELVSQGVANLASGISGGFPVGGSFSRSSVDRQAGGKTRWAGAVTGLAVLAFLPGAGILSSLPLAVLGAIVIAAVAPLIRLTPLLTMWRYSRPQTVVLWTTFALTLALSPRIDIAIITGVGLGVLIHLWRELSVHLDAEFADGTVRFRPSGVLFFGSAPQLNQALREQLAAHPQAGRVVFDLGSLGRIDYTGALALKMVADQCHAAGVEVAFDRVPLQARRLLDRVWHQRLPMILEP